MSKIYIAGKITGLNNYKEVFEEAENELNSKGHICMNPAKLPEGFIWEVYMPICYAMIDACDCVYMLSNWIDSKGAKMKYEYARSKNKIIRFEQTTIDWESDFIGLKKTVELNKEQLKALEDGIKNMSKVMPYSASDIAAMPCKIKELNKTYKEPIKEKKEEDSYEGE